MEAIKTNDSSDLATTTYGGLGKSLEKGSRIIDDDIVARIKEPICDSNLKLIPLLIEVETTDNLAITYTLNNSSGDLPNRVLAKSKPDSMGDMGLHMISLSEGGLAKSTHVSSQPDRLGSNNGMHGTIDVPNFGFTFGANSVEK